MLPNQRKGRKRIFRDAPDWLRCGARITLKDGSYAQCGRYQNDGYFRNPHGPGSVCTQHGDMISAGKAVWRFFDNSLMRFKTR